MQGGGGGVGRVRESDVVRCVECVSTGLSLAERTHNKDTH